MSLGHTLSRCALTAGRVLVGRRFSKAIDELQRTEKLSPDELRARQNQKLAVVCEHAARTVPYWRDVYAERGLSPDAIRTVEDLHQLPILDKDVVRSRPFGDFLSEAVPKHRHEEFLTSGSTGDPFRFVLDRAMAPIVFASHLYFDSWYGLDALDRYLRVSTPAPTSPGKTADAPLKARLLYRFRERLQGVYESLTQRRFSTFDTDAELFRTTYESFQPDYLMGYTATLSRIAEELTLRGWCAEKPLKAIITIAENLTQERQNAIEQCFQGPIANRYGQREFKFWIAQSEPPTPGQTHDPHRFRFVTELAVAESIHDDGSQCEAGEVGRLVVTNLHNFAMPFLRYDSKDIAALEPNDGTNGRNLPWITMLRGRSQEILPTKDGRTIDSTTLGHFLFAVRGFANQIRLYQLEESGHDSVLLRVVPSQDFGDADRQRLAHALLEILGPGFDVRIDVVDTIPVERSGKRPIIKRLRERAGGST